jgi:hypothetical protein
LRRKQVQETIVVEERFRGPPRSGNGGYVCGAFGELLTRGDHALPGKRAAQITLRSPIPLDTPMEVRRGHESLGIHHGDTLIAEGRLVELVLDVPPMPGFDEAHAVRGRSPAYARNASRALPDKIGFHPLCFCCGVEHEDGLHVTAAPLRNGEIVAAAWQTQARWADAAGNVPPRFLWTALDCPGQFAFYAGGIRTGMLGQLAARIEHPLRAGERCVVTGWRIGVEGRRHYAGTAIFDAAGKLCAYAKAIWVGRREG